MPGPVQGPTVKPATYLFLGLALFVVKFVIDRLVAASFGRGWDFMNYLIPSEVYTLTSLPPQERGFFLVMLVVALPFAVAGLLLTWWRLRDAGLPKSLVVLFFMPAVNLVFFATLGFWPSRPAPGDRTGRGGDRPSPAPVEEAARLVRRRLSPGRFFMAALAGAWTAAVCIIIGVLVFRSYGWGAFVAAPFVCGMLAAWINGYTEPRPAEESLAAAMVALALVGLGLLILAVEGLICLMMAAPLALVLALLGGCLGQALATERHRRNRMQRGFEVLPALCVPLLIAGAEFLQPAAPAVHRVTTSIVIDAPPEVVWRHVLAFPQLPEPRHWLFRTGIAYPVSARIDGHGIGAIRYCQFSTGAFVEPISMWQPPGMASADGLLRFDVVENPPPLREWSWTGISPPHLEGFLVSRQGQFRLIALPDGRTRLEGSTWYEHAIRPDPYWRLWSDWIIGRVHSEVLWHMRELAEAELAGEPRRP